jgi:predicted DNA-binding transcriptional regulator AlpA
VRLPMTELESLLDQFATLMAEKVAVALQRNGGLKASAVEPDRLLDVEEASHVIGTTPSWLRRHNELPFVRRLGRRTIRYSAAGITRWIAAGRR